MPKCCGTKNPVVGELQCEPGRGCGLLRLMARMRLAAVIWASLLAVVPALALARTQTASRAQLEAQFLFNTLKFVRWPATRFENDRSPIIVGIVGSEAVASHLERLAREKTVLGRTVVVRRISADSELYSCHAVFLGLSHRERTNEILRQIQQGSTLTVGEGKGFSSAGGMIDLVVDRGKVHFGMNRPALLRSRLYVSSKLLRMAGPVSQAYLERQR